jgi:hypothetical protein
MARTTKPLTAKLAKDIREGREEKPYDSKYSSICWTHYTSFFGIAKAMPWDKSPPPQFSQILAALFYEIENASPEARVCFVFKLTLLTPIPSVAPLPPEEH